MVLSRRELLATGCTPDELRARLAAGRWRSMGRAVVLHNGGLDRGQSCRAALANCGPRSVLASFTAAESLGLTGWMRTEIHVLVPSGVPAPKVPGLRIVLHRTSRFDVNATMLPRRCQRIAPAVVLAAGSFASPRPGCGILAAAVQQRLTDARALRQALQIASRTRHRRHLAAAVDDIEMGAQALSEIDFVGLCRRYGLPRPRRQAVRHQSDGRRRYVDAEWTTADGRVVAAEVDGAVHLAPSRWIDDQLRQNEIVLGGVVVLRFPSVIVRTDPRRVAAQLRRALAPGS
jgi:hypothetical protein